MTWKPQREAGFWMGKPPRVKAALGVEGTGVGVTCVVTGVVTGVIDDKKERVEGNT